MLIFSYVIKHIIINKNKILHKLFYALFAPTTRKVKISKSVPESVSEFYVYNSKNIYDKFEVYIL
jgi:hypothetical protein